VPYNKFETTINQLKSFLNVTNFTLNPFHHRISNEHIPVQQIYNAHLQ